MKPGAFTRPLGLEVRKDDRHRARLMPRHVPIAQLARRSDREICQLAIGGKPLPFSFRHQVSRSPLSGCLLFDIRLVVYSGSIYNLFILHPSYAKYFSSTPQSPETKHWSSCRGNGRRSFTLDVIAYLLDSRLYRTLAFPKYITNIRTSCWAGPCNKCRDCFAAGTPGLNHYALVRTNEREQSHGPVWLSEVDLLVC